MLATRAVAGSRLLTPALASVLVSLRVRVPQLSDRATLDVSERHQIRICLTALPAEAATGTVWQRSSLPWSS